MYSVINDALNQVFLGGRFESRPIYLVLDKRGRIELSEILDETPETVEAICCGAVGQQLRKTGDPYSGFETELIKWRTLGRRTPPPFTALLFTLAHAAELMVSDGQFNSSNYYRRLAGLTGADWQKLSLKGSSTEKFWAYFNQWLADTDFRHGRPTARITSTLRYVSLAMSQAILREEDRHRFHDLFEKYGFTGTDSVTEEEISHYISSWITTSKPTRQLKQAWAKPELRERIAEVALAELDDWAQASGNSTEPASRRSRLSLALSFRHDLLSRSVALWVGKEASLEATSLHGGAVSYEFANSSFGSFATIEPRSAIDWSAALLRGLDFEEPSGIHHNWAARAVIPLSRSEKGSYWTEVNRATLGVPHLVLSRAEPTVRNSVERALQEIAADGYTLATPSTLPGLPAGWLLYENVRILRSLDELKGFEAALSPVGTTSGVQFLGGLRLGKGIWHEWDPPTAVFEVSDATAKLFAWEGTSNDGTPQCEIIAPDGDARLNLADCVPPTGNLYLEGWTDKAKLSSSTVLLRTAARPRPLDRQARALLGYVSALTAVPMASTDAPLVRGFIVPPLAEQPDSPVRLEDFRQLGLACEVTAEREDDETAPAGQATDLSSMSLQDLLKLPCAVRGFHVFKVDTVPADYPKTAPVNMQCKGCGVSMLLPRRKKESTGRKPSSGARREVPPSPASFIRDTLRLPVNLWLEAACFLGEGTIAAFEGLVASQEVDPWEARAILRDLSWLGHVDVQIGPTYRPRYWSVAPPTLAFHEGDQAVLAGFRNGPLLEELTRRVEAAGGVCDEEYCDRQSKIIRVRGLRASEAQSALAETRDVHGRPLCVVENAGTRLATFCAGSASAFAAMRPMTLGNLGSIQKYDVEAGRWRHVESTSQVGAYRFSYAGTCYAIRSPNGAFSGPPELVKLVAARLEGARLHAYAFEERTFISRLGCEPTGVLGRALVACSGRLPSVSNGTSRFDNVPPNVAATVLAALYHGDLPS